MKAFNQMLLGFMLFVNMHLVLGSDMGKRISKFEQINDETEGQHINVINIMTAARMCISQKSCMGFDIDSEGMYPVTFIDLFYYLSIHNLLKLYIVQLLATLGNVRDVSQLSNDSYDVSPHYICSCLWVPQL